MAASSLANGFKGIRSITSEGGSPDSRRVPVAPQTVRSRAGPVSKADNPNSGANSADSDQIGIGVRFDRNPHDTAGADEANRVCAHSPSVLGCGCYRGRHGFTQAAVFHLHGPVKDIQGSVVVRDH